MSEIDQRFLRYVIYDGDKTQAMTNRFLSNGDVLFVDNPESPYNAPEIKGIQGIYHSIAYKGADGDIKLETRPFNCYCADCSALQFQSCKYTSEYGTYTGRKVGRVQKPIVSTTSAAVGSKEAKLENFKDFLRNDDKNTEPILIAVANPYLDSNQNSFSLALLQTQPFKVKKTFSETHQNIEYAQTGILTNDPNSYSVLFNAGDVLVKVKPLLCLSEETNEFVAQSQVILLKIDCLVIPDMEQCNAFNYIKYVRSAQILANKGFGRKEQTVYQILDESLSMLDELARRHVHESQLNTTS